MNHIERIHHEASRRSRHQTETHDKRSMAAKGV